MPAYQQAVKLSPLAIAQVPEATSGRRRGDRGLPSVVQSVGMDRRARPPHGCTYLPKSVVASPKRRSKPHGKPPKKFEMT